MQFKVAFRQSAGYVVHEPSMKPWQNVMVAVGPFFVNTIVGSVIAAPAAVTVLQYGSKDPLDWLLMWLGVSIAMHSFPSTGDAASIWKSVQKAPPVTKYLAMPVLGVIYLGAIGSVVWLDALYGVFVVGFVPDALIKWLA